MQVSSRVIVAAGVLGGILWAGFPTPLAAQDDIGRMKAEYRRPPAPAVATQALVDLGRDPFFDPRISASGKTACASCHFPELGWAVTDAAAPMIPASRRRASRNR